MADEFREVTKVGWGENIKNSIIGALVGILLFFLSFFVLWMNEGRVNMGKVAEKTLAARAEQIDAAREGQPVSVTARLTSTETLGDPEFLQPGQYITLSRTVEMFAWVEIKETKEKQNTGGSTTKETTWRYEKRWTANPKGPADFKYSEGHRNPPMPFEGREFAVTTAAVGAYEIDPAGISLPAPSPLTPRGDELAVRGRYQASGQYLFIGSGRPEEPQVGDVRVSFAALSGGTRVTAFGKLEGGRLAPYLHKGKDRLYRAVAGERDEAVARLKQEHKVTGWMLRLIGFLMMWFGLQALFGPIVSVLTVLPFLGKIGRFVWGLITFFVSLALSLVVIVVSMIAHNIWALLVVLVAVVGTFLWLRSRKKPTPAAAPAA